MTTFLLNVKIGLDSDADLKTLKKILQEVEEKSHKMEEAFYSILQVDANYDPTILLAESKQN